MTTFRSNLLAALAVILTLAVPAMAQDQQASPEKMALAKQYVDTVPVETEIRRAVEGMAQQVPPEQRVLFKQLADKSIDFTRLRTSAEQAVAATFTDEEIKAMTAFYGSPVGRSVRAKMPEYDRLMQPVMMDVMKQFVARLQENSVVPNPGASQPQ